MNKKAIYTSVVGKYDSLTNPKYIIPNWDYICFSNNIKKKKGSIWEIRPIPFKHSNNTILSRYPKMNPHIVLKEYEYSLWIDANIEILDDFVEQRLNELIGNEIILSLIPHPYRDCIYKEAKYCIDRDRDSRMIIEKQVAFLKKEKYPENNGLFENGLIFRYHTDPKITSMDKEWWKIYLRFSKRDQLSLCYLIWKNNIHCEPFTSIGFSVRNIPSIRFTPHKTSLKNIIKGYIQRNNKLNKLVLFLLHSRRNIGYLYNAAFSRKLY